MAPTRLLKVVLIKKLKQGKGFVQTNERRLVKLKSLLCA